MLSEIGTFFLILALCLSIIQAISCLDFFPKKLCTWMACGQFFFLIGAILILIINLVTNDATVAYVLEHTHPTLPLIYKMGAAWGGHEGSLLLWCVILSFWTLLFVFAKADKNSFHQNIISILGFIQSGFLFFLLFTSNPFARIFSLQPLTGGDLTPVLQDPGLIFHPPMLYTGYVGFVIAFAFSISILLSKETPTNWASELRPWVILPWFFLGCGIVLGSWWSYRELGWGGWWFWDPVENASLMPWLCGTALLHSLIVTEKRNSFSLWSIFFCILTFSLSLIGTFLVRSGILVSVHAFATDPTRGIFLLIWLSLLIGGSFILFIIKSNQYYKSINFYVLSKETLLLVNTILLLTGIFILILGTLYPIILDALSLEKISVGAPYYKILFTPLFLILIATMSLVPYIKWHKSSFPQLKNLSIGIMGGTIFLCIPLFLGKHFYFSTTLGLYFSGFLFFTTIFKKSTLSMTVAHIGLAIVALSITINLSYNEERQLQIYPHEKIKFAGQSIIFENVTNSKGPNYYSWQAHFKIANNELIAEQKIYTSHQELFNRPGILIGLWHDLYIAPSNINKNGSWVVRIYYRPFVRFIWIGGFITLLGGLLSKVYRQKKFYE